MLTQAEKEQAAREVRALIVGSDQTAILQRPTGSRLYGSDDQAVVEVGTLAVEVVETPAVDLARNIDATGHVLPGADIKLADRLRLDGVEYRIQSIKRENLFGVTTHQVVKLVQLRGG